MGGPYGRLLGFQLTRRVGSEIAKRIDITATATCNDKNLAAISDPRSGTRPRPRAARRARRRMRQAALSGNASVGSILASDDRLGPDKSEALVRRRAGLSGARSRLRVLMDECG